MPLPIHPDDAERGRLSALRACWPDGSGAEAALDRVARLAADLFEARAALVCFLGEAGAALVGGLSSPAGLDAGWVAAPCARVVAGEGTLVVPDAPTDPRFAGLAGGVRFWAGAPVRSPCGQRVGAVLVLDVAPRPPWGARERGLLGQLADVASDHLARRHAEALGRAALEMAAACPDALIGSDGEGRVTFWNPAAQRVFGHGRGEIVGRPLEELVAPALRARHRADMLELRAEGGARATGRFDARGVRRDGTEVPVEVSTAARRDGPRVNVGTVVRDLSERERARQLAEFDGLTGLPNRGSFLDHVGQALARAEGFTVLKAGLDRFKAVNGAMGMAAGDRLLVAAAGRVRAEAGEGALVARLGADEFGVLVAGRDGAAGAEGVARRLVERLGEPYEVGGATCHVGASVGLVHCPGAPSPDTADGVVRRAMLALQSAKAAGGRRVAPFQARLGEDAEERRHVEDALRVALARGEFELHFQPQVALPGGRLLGAEALLRWHHPSRGLLPPGSFLPALERSDAAVAVGRWIVREVCAFAAGMAARGTPVQVGINLFAAQLRDPGLPRDVAEALAATGLPGSLLEVEITETTVLGLDEAAIAPLRRLRDLGVGVAFDDYGTGYASLSLLKRYPLTRLKVDREFVRDLHADPDDAAIVKAVIALGASLGLSVIAEGIETVEQAEALAGFGCREAQGYLFGRPVPSADFAARHAPAARPAGAA